MRIPLRLVLGTVLALTLVSCGDPDLWARYRAERAWWGAVRQVERIRIKPALASAGDYARAESAFEDIVETFPPETWCSPASVERPIARDVGVISAQSLVALGRLSDWQGRSEEALARYESALEAGGNLREVAEDAAVDRAFVLERLERPIDAANAWTRVAESFELLDERGEVRPNVARASGRAAELLTDADHAREAQVVLRAAEAKALDALERDDASAGRPDLWRHLALTRMALDDLDGAVAAWREVAKVARNGAQRGSALIDIAEAFMEAGQPDSATPYAALTAKGYGRSVAVEGALLRARALYAEGLPDSALRAYEDILEDYSRDAAACARAQFARGRIYEDIDNWVLARSQYRALAARYPTHDLAFDSYLRIVNYHHRRGEIELARVEGKRSLEIVDRIIQHQRDRDIQFIARWTRARILEAMESNEEAFEALEAFWQRYPRTERGVEAAFAAAALAEGPLGEPSDALQLYRQVDSDAPTVEVRERARAAIERLGSQARGS